MAKLGSYYGLCPLIDQKSLLGISEDIDSGYVIVTLGRNMAITYKLSDQKQIHSWSTKEKLSSPVVFDKKEGRYVAVFNHHFMRLWNSTEKNLEKVKKIKFPIALHTVLSCEDEPILIFKTGHVYTLSYALEVKKDIPHTYIYDKTYSIENQTCLKVNDKYYVGILLKSKNSYQYLWSPPNNNDEENIKKIILERSNVILLGHLTTDTDTGPTLFTLWSDGRLFSYPLSPTNETIKPPGNFFSVVESLSRKHQVSMVSLNNNYMALYGAESNQEGASLQIYNTQFKVTQSKHQFKLFSESAKLWLIGSSLLLTVGQNLAVIPFQLATEQLAALVGSHKLAATADDEDIAIVIEMQIGEWENMGKTINKATNNKIPHEIKSQLTSFIKEGWSENAICEEIFPKLVEKQDDTTILNCLNYFTDIPEIILVKLLSYSISSNSTNIRNVQNNELPISCKTLLDKILATSYSDVLLMSHLRSLLKFDEVLVLLQYLCYLLSENGHSLTGVTISESEAKIIDWGCLLLDAHYQQLLLSRDENIAKSLQYFKELVDNYYLCLNDLKNVEPILSRLCRGKCASKVANGGSLKYSIEKLNIC